MQPVISYLIKYVVIIGLIYGSAVCATPLGERAIFNVGVLALRGESHAHKAWSPTIDWLAQQMPSYEFMLHTYDFEQLEQAFLAGELDFILTSPGQALQLARQHPINWLATQKTSYSAIENRSIASVVVVNANSSFTTLADIDGAHIGAVSKKAFGGFLALHYELHKQGCFTATFFDNVQFIASPTDELLLSVIAGRFDAVIVPACTLESMVNEGTIDLNQVRVINGSRPANSICTVSTALYPNWTFAMSERVPMAVGFGVSQALLNMPPDHPAAIAAHNRGWTLPASTIDIETVYQHLDKQSLEKPLQQEVTEWLHRHRSITSLITLISLLLITYHIWLELRFRDSRNQLHQTMNELRHKSAMLEHAQRITIVGELGSSLAHEINQPLAAIKNYCQGAKLRVAGGEPSANLVSVLEKIQQQVRAASDIVQRLRTLIRKRSINMEWFNLAQLVDESITLVDYELEHNNIQLTVTYSGNIVPIWADKIGIQQVLLNILTNAKDACIVLNGKRSALLIELHLIYYQDMVEIRVLDNGIGLTTKSIELLQPFYSTKPDGLGLGLVICRDIINAHQGSLAFHPRLPHGCQVTIILPYKKSFHES